MEQKSGRQKSEPSKAKVKQSSRDFGERLKPETWLCAALCERFTDLETQP